MYNLYVKEGDDNVVIIVFFTLGLLVGSFLNVCIYRIPNKQSILWPGSHCPICNNNLKPIDLVPVLSYVFLRTRCRYCSTKISYRYALIEIITAIVYTSIYISFNSHRELLLYILLCTLLIVIAFIDFDKNKISKKLISAYGIMSASISLNRVFLQKDIIEISMGFLVKFLLIYILSKVYKHYKEEQFKSKILLIFFIILLLQIKEILIVFTGIIITLIIYKKHKKIMPIIFYISIYSYVCLMV